MSRSLLILLALLVVLGVGAYLLGQDEEASFRVSTSVADALGGDTAGYARATCVRGFSFPEDHGPHLAYKTEWWYVTGNLEAESGRHFGYQFTIFRVALAPPDSVQAADTTRSDWRTNQLYMAHFAVTDVRAGTHRASERFSRGAVGLAGAQAPPFAVWLEDWRLESTPAEGFFPLHLQAGQGGMAIDLTLRRGKPRVLQGEAGFSRKGPQPGNASYYYSFTRLPTAGTLAAGSDTFAVEGASWIDREWSTSALGAAQEGWDWFALRLSDGRELMYYQIRNEGDAPSRFSEGILVGPEGETDTIARDEIRVRVLERWESPRGGTYPAKWRLRVPSEELALTVTPYVADQELDVSVRYWEGAVRVEGTAGGQPVTGSGYVELTGYAGSSGEGEGKRVFP